MDSSFNLYNGININYSSELKIELINKNGLNILYFNGRSIKNKISDIELFLSYLNCIVHIVVITETWLDENNEMFFNLKNYNSFHNNRRKHAGGVAIFCHSSIISEVVLSETFLDNSHCLIIKLVHYNIHVATIYRAPDGNINDFTSFFSEKLNSYKNILYVGDFNINVLNEFRKEVLNFKSIVESDGYVIMNNLSLDMATRVTDSSLSTIDLVITDLVKYKYNFTVDDLSFSDHKLIFLNMNIDSVNITNKLIQSVHINYNKIKTDIAENSEIAASSSYEDLSEKIKNICSLNKSIKNKKIRITSYKQEWSSKELTKLVKKRKLFYDLFKKYPGNDFYSRKYGELDMIVKKTADDDKKKYFGNKFNSALCNPRQTWGLINELIYNKKSISKSNIPKKIISNNKEICDPSDICDVFNEFFTEIGSSLASSGQSAPPISSVNAPSNFLTDFSPVTEVEVLNIIQSLNSKAAAGFDGISVRVVKDSATALTPVLTKLINECFLRGEFPDALKVARVVPIFKNGSKSDPGNYRPVSILPIISKIFEIAIKNRLLDFMMLNSIIHENQYGFQKNSNTTAACLNLIENIYKNIENKKKAASLFIDVRKAFDSVDHVVLCDKLGKIGLKGIALDLLKNYLVNRKQYVMFDDHRSSQLLIKTGVPQGSILGPFLFIIFMNDIFDCRINGSLQLYADDATIVYGENSFLELQEKMFEDITTIQKWMESNKLSMNLKKTNFILFHMRNSDLTNIFNEICFGNIKINRVESEKYLGIVIDKDLNWTQHIDSIKRKISSFVGVLKRISKFINEKTKKDIYFAYIHSHLTYGNPIWSTAPLYKLKELQVFQNKAMKEIYNLSRLTPSKLLYKDSILPVLILSKYELNLLTFKIENNLIKSNLTFKISNEVHSYSTRISNNFRAIFCRTKLTKNSIQSRGVGLFNQLPLYIKQEIRFMKFKNELKKHFIHVVKSSTDL